MTSPSAESERWVHRPALDGVRAIAVVVVVGFHFWERTFPGGFIGVDVFFVLSGYLITGILMVEHRSTGTVDLRAFWMRRVRRLVPAVLVLAAVTSVAAGWTGTGSARQLADSVGALTWTTNFVESALSGSRLMAVNSRTTLDHLWSLAIEEQFYVVWPLVALLLFARVRSTARRLGVVVGLVVASALAMGLTDDLQAYFRTDTRAFELLIGAVLAIGGAGSWALSPRTRGLAGVVGLVGIGACVVLLQPSDEWLYPWGFLLVAVIAGSLVVASLEPPRWLAFGLQHRLIAAVGQRSYGIYLWHIPVLRLLSVRRVGIDGIGLHILRFAVLAAVVEASYRWVEQPVRTGATRLTAGRVALGYGLVVLSLIPLVPATRRDLDARWDALTRPPTIAAGTESTLVMGDLVGAVIGEELDDRSTWSVADPGCGGLSAPVPRGTSGAEGSADVTDEGEAFEVRLPDGPLEVDRYCAYWPRRVERAVERFEPDRVIIAGGFWDSLEVARLGSGGDPDVTVSGPSLVALYRDLVRSQIAVAQTGEDTRREVLVVIIEDWSNLIEVGERPVGERLEALDDYRSAQLDVVSSSRNVEAVEVPGAPSWDDLRRFARQLR